METTTVTTVKKTFVETTQIPKPQVAEPEKVVVTRVLKKIPQEEDKKPLEGEPQAPTGYEYETVIESVIKNGTVTRKTVRRLKPIIDTHKPLPNEPEAPEGYEYETVQDVDENI